MFLFVNGFKSCCSSFLVCLFLTILWYWNGANTFWRHLMLPTRWEKIYSDLFPHGIAIALIKCLNMSLSENLVWASRQQKWVIEFPQALVFTFLLSVFHLVSLSLICRVNWLISSQCQNCLLLWHPNYISILWAPYQGSTAAKMNQPGKWAPGTTNMHSSFI